MMFCASSVQTEELVLLATVMLGPHKSYAHKCGGAACGGKHRAKG